MGKSLNFVGLDVALGRTGMAIVDGEFGKVEVFSITTNRKEDDYSRQISALYQILAKIKKGDIVVLEDFGLASRYSQSGKSCERQQLLGMLLLELPKVTGISFLLCPPNYHKGGICGKASAHKEDARKVLDEVFGIPTRNLDESDACCLALMGRAAVYPDLAWSRKRLDFVEKFRNYKQNKNFFSQLQISA